MLDSISSNLAAQALALIAVVLCSAARRYAVSHIEAFGCRRQVIATLAWVTEIIQLTLAVLGVYKSIVHAVCLFSAHQDRRYGSTALRMSNFFDMAVRLLSYCLSILAVDTIDLWIISGAENVPHFFKLFTLIRSLTEANRIWVLEPAPLPPMPKRWLKQSGASSPTPRSQRTVWTEVNQVAMATSSSQRPREASPEEPARGRTRTRTPLQYMNSQPARRAAFPGEHSTRIIRDTVACGAPTRVAAVGGVTRAQTSPLTPPGSSDGSDSSTVVSHLRPGPPRIPSPALEKMILNNAPHLP